MSYLEGSVFGSCGLVLFVDDKSQRLGYGAKDKELGDLRD
jgi:hypothetical protein